MSFRIRFLAAVFAASALASAAPAQSTLAVNYLPDEADADLLDGVCDCDLPTPGNQCSLRAAIEQACALGGAWQIQLGAQVYGLARVGTEDCGRWGDLDIHGCYATVTSMEIVGVPGQTVIDASGLQFGGGPERVLHVTSTVPTTTPVILRDVTLTGGETGFGGGIRHEGGHLQLVDVVLDGNEAGQGGGLHTVGRVTMAGGFVSNNTATATLGTGKGGGVYAEAGAVVDTAGTVFELNVAGLGGGLDVQAGAQVFMTDSLLLFNQNAGARNIGYLALDRCVVEGNVNSGSGGGIDNRGTLEATLTEFRSNQAQAGGGVNSSANASATFTECTLDANDATNLGGGLATSSAAELIRTTVSNNTTSGFAGGGIYAFGTASGGLQMVNSTVALNQAVSGSGGGLYLAGFAVHQVSSSTVAFNLAASGGGVWSDTTSETKSSAYADNVEAGGTYQNFAGPTPMTSFGFNLDSDGTGLLLDPSDRTGVAGVGPLDDNGGPTQTCALLLGSQAVDAGDCAALNGNQLTEDQRGQARGADCDIGAFELQFTFDSFCDASDGALVSCPCANPGAPDTGCDNAQGTGGVRAAVTAFDRTTLHTTLTATGFPPMATPTAIVIRAQNQEPVPVAFGDGLRCVGLAGFSRLAATVAVGGTSTHSFGFGAGFGTRYHQVWYRNTPTTFCVTTGPSTGAFNLSNGVKVP